MLKRLTSRLYAPIDAETGLAAGGRLQQSKEVSLRYTAVSAAILTIALVSCGSPDSADEATMDTLSEDGAQQAVAMIQTAEGESVGSATATEAGGSVLISLNVEGLSPGERGVHVHMTGACEGPDFQSAGGHWNPNDAQHGLHNPAGQHAGDMPNLVVGEDGTGSLEYQLVGGTFDGLLDADGSAFVIHAMADDQVTDPSGNSGDRIACGIFQAS